MLSWKRNRNWNRKKAEWNNSSNRLHRIFKTWRLLRHWNFGITQSRVATRHFPSTMSWIFHLTDIVAIHKMCFFFACVCLDSLVKRVFFPRKRKSTAGNMSGLPFPFPSFIYFLNFFILSLFCRMTIQDANEYANERRSQVDTVLVIDSKMDDVARFRTINIRFVRGEGKKKRELFFPHGVGINQISALIDLIFVFFCLFVIYLL